jgi:hypothetical protein
MRLATPAPVVFLTFNRPETTSLVFERIRAAKPNKLFLVSDGPRAIREGEADKVESVRNIIRQVDWDCDVKEIFSATNMGCRERVRTGITEALNEVDQVIILEDDCLPDSTWFSFATEMLTYFKAESNILSVRGDNYQRGRRFGKGCYYFSKYPTCWGWAVWRRSWELIDTDLSDWPQQVDSGMLSRSCESEEEIEYWRNIFEDTYKKSVDSWAYAWVYASFKYSGIHVTPNVNLIRNIGFDADATHTKNGRPRWAPYSLGQIDSINHPGDRIVSATADHREFLWMHLNREPDLARRLLKLEPIRSLLRGFRRKHMRLR